MSINITAANNQANQIYSYAQQLRNTKTQLLSYKSSLQLNWSGQEVPFILKSIDQTLDRINAIIKELELLSNDVKGAANTIKREEEAAAAAARARAEKQRQINKAQTDYNNSIKEYNDALEEMDKFQKEVAKNPFLKFHPNYNKRYEELQKKIADAAKKRDKCKNALSNAKR
ncbi:MAG: hypothetical protein IKU08_06725 [Clostridia bacterium]|nr:hypothetical protein [Clostridia bacterium]